MELVVTTSMSRNSTRQEALQKAFGEIKKSEDRLRLVIDTIPTLVWRARPDGSPIFSINRRSTTPVLPGSGRDRLASRLHPDDRKGMLVKWSATGVRYAELEARLRRFDGEYRWFFPRPCRCAMSTET
jgi:PAS domain-containing protein